MRARKCLTSILLLWPIFSHNEWRPKESADVEQDKKTAHTSRASRPSEFTWITHLNVLLQIDKFNHKYNFLINIKFIILLLRFTIYELLPFSLCFSLFLWEAFLCVPYQFLHHHVYFFHCRRKLQVVMVRQHTCYKFLSVWSLLDFSLSIVLKCEYTGGRASWKHLCWKRSYWSQHYSRSVFAV